MQTEEILSAGIDIGTSTTQLVFSRMILQNTGGFGRIPQIKVVSKEVIYESEIYFTPLSSREEIDGERVHEIIKKEYEKAGVCPADLATGAVIITGETSRKRNAESVVRAIADVAGEFVVATAGADLESVLAGKGAAGRQNRKSCADSPLRWRNFLRRQCIWRRRQQSFPTCRPTIFWRMARRPIL